MDLEEFVPDPRSDITLKPEKKIEVCQYDKCKRLALYFWPGGLPVLCRIHKKREMKRVLKQKITCTYTDCQVPAIYGHKYRTQTDPVSCWAHKHREMINLSTVCDFEYCIKKAKFNLKSGARYCTTHRFALT